jgi:hypothetical protein
LYILLIDDAMDITGKIVQNGLELKKYKEVMGHEGPAFSCEIWHNGKKAVLVMNDGNGGCNSYHEYEKGIVDLLAEIGKAEADYDPEDHTVTEMLVMLGRKRQMARWAKKGLDYAVEVVFKEPDILAKSPTFEYDVQMFAADSEQQVIAGLSRLKKPFKRAHWIKPDGSLGDALP